MDNFMFLNNHIKFSLIFWKQSIYDKTHNAFLKARV